MIARKIIHIDMDAFYASVEQRDVVLGSAGTLFLWLINLFELLLIAAGLMQSLAVVVVNTNPKIQLSLLAAKSSALSKVSQSFQRGPLGHVRVSNRSS
jgi:hypothetical protein